MEQKTGKNKIVLLSRKISKLIKEIIHDTLHIKDGTDFEGTSEGIKRDIVFKGHSIWILTASIFIASIGLNQNSPAVVIGAMLISPLMGPILGVGLAVGTYDWETLKRSMKFFAIAIFVSIIASTLYFLITPIKDAQSELLARTQPNLLDVFIAIFGGTAGIVAGSRKEKTNVIPGVAIATALMPPLCTAGYGLATAQYNYFFGAFYLFFINSFFISLSTVIVVRYLRFPLINYLSKEREHKIRIYTLIFIILIILPSAKIFWSVIQESRFHYRVEEFIADNFDDIKSDIIYKNISYSDTISYIDLYLAERLYTDAQLLDFNDKLKEYGLYGKHSIGILVTDSTALNIHQENNNVDSLVSKMDDMSANIQKKLRVGILEDIYKKQDEIIEGKNQRIDFFEKRIEYLEDIIIDIKKDTLPLAGLRAEINVQYPEITKFAYAKSIEPNLNGTYDTVSVFLVKWKRWTGKRQIRKKTEMLKNWMKVRFKLDTVRVVKY